MNDNDLLKYAVEHGMIDLTRIQSEVEMTRREELLNQFPYKIFYGSDNYWHTYVPDNTKKNGRKAVKKKSKADIEALAVEYVLEQEKQAKKEEEKKEKQNITLYELFPLWIKYKTLHTRSTSYIKRITNDWHKYYANDSQLINRPLTEFSKMDFDKWAHGIIKEMNLSKKQYYNMSIILRECLDYAVENEYIQENLFRLVKINTKLFRKVKKQDAKTQVYLTNEIPQMIFEMLRRFKNNPSDTTPLGVLLVFETGVRVGELLALRKSDISEDFTTIHIQRQMVKTYKSIDDYSMVFDKYVEVEYAKTDDGDREVYLTQVARNILKIILEVNQIYGHKYEDAIFVKGNQRLTYYGIQSRMIRGCETIGILTKSIHKVRKTYISTLIDSGLNIDEIRKLAGHSDERTTYGNYCFNRLIPEETAKMLDEALNYDIPLEDFKDDNLLEVIKSNQNQSALSA